jgi:hypothetical protein
VANTVVIETWFFADTFQKPVAKNLRNNVWNNLTYVDQGFRSKTGKQALRLADALP